MGKRLPGLSTQILQKMNKHLNYFLLSLVIVVSACEQKVDVQRYGFIKGTVLTNETDEGLANVRISTSPASTVALTDANGNFSLEGVPAGEVNVTAEKKDYKIQTVAVNITAEDTTNAFLVLDFNGTGSTTGEEDGEIVNPFPSDNSTGVSIDTNLRWQFNGDTSGITFDVFLYSTQAATPIQIASGISDSTTDLGQLTFGTTYFWYVKVLRNDISVLVSDVYQFTTEALPDNRLVYATDSTGSYNIFSSGSAGENEIQLTNSVHRDWNPELSPVLNKVAFASNRSGDYHIYTINREGNNLIKASALPVAGYHNNGLGYCFDPNGGGFLYSNYNKLLYVNQDGSGLQTITDSVPAGKNWRELDWNGATRKIVAQAVGVNVYNSEIYLMDEDASNWQLIIPDAPGRTDHPVFSLDGNKLLYTQDVSGLNAQNGRQIDAHIFVLDLNTMAITDLSYDKVAGTNDLYPEFSANNGQIIFVNEDNTGTGISTIMTMDIDGENREVLIPNATMPHAF